MTKTRRMAGAAALVVVGSQAWGVDLHPGDILISDSNNFTDKISRIDPATGEQTVISSGGLLSHPYELVLGPNNEIFVLENDLEDGAKGIIEIDPVTGDQTVIRNIETSIVHGLALDPNGDFYVTDSYLNRLFRIDESNNMTLIAEGGNLIKPQGLALDPVTGDILVAAVGPKEGEDDIDGRIVRVDPVTRQQTVVAEGGLLMDPYDVVVGPGLKLYVADQDNPDWQTHFGQVVRIDPVTGEQTRLDLTQVFGAFAVAIGLDDMVVTADPGPSTGSGKVQRLNALVPGTPEDLISALNFHPTGITVVGSPCPWDCDGSGDGNANVADLLTLLGQWDSVGPGTCNGGSCDFNLDGCTNVVDLLMLLSHYTTDPSGVGCP